MKIAPEDVEKVALLARLELTAAEAEKYAAQLEDTMRYAGQMDEVDTEGIPPTSHLFPARHVLRDDAVRPSLPREKVLGNAPETEGGCFKVPRII